MKIGILLAVVGSLGEKGFYQRQEIGLGRELAAMGHDVTVYRAVAKNGNGGEERLEERLLVKYIPVRALGFHGLFPTEKLDPELQGLLMFSDTQFSMPAVYRWCRKHGIVFVPYVGVAHSQRSGLHARAMALL